MPFLKTLSKPCCYYKIKLMFTWNIIIHVTEKKLAQEERTEVITPRGTLIKEQAFLFKLFKTFDLDKTSHERIQMWVGRSINETE